MIDYTSTFKIEIRRIQGQLYMLSGRDVSEIKELENQKAIERKEIAQNPEIKQDMFKRLLQANTYSEIDEEIIRRSEHCKNGTLTTKITLNSSAAPAKNRWELPSRYQNGKSKPDFKLDEFNYRCHNTSDCNDSYGQRYSSDTRKEMKL